MSDEHDDEVGDEGVDAYNVMADKVGFVPNVRAKDNLYQGIAVLVCAVIGALVAYLMSSPREPMMGALGAVGGMIVGVIGSGAVLAVIGLMRKS